MNKDFENKLQAMNDQDLASVSGGTGGNDHSSLYSVGQRIRVLLNTGEGKIVLIGTITAIDIRMHTYDLTLDAPAPNGETNVFCFESSVLGLA